MHAQGRTGVMIAIFLQYTKVVPDAASSLLYFDSVRTADGKGITIPSQKRYVHYFERMLRDYDSSKPLPLCPELILCRLEVLGIPRVDRDGCEVYMEVYRDRELIYTSKGMSDMKRYVHGVDKSIVFKNVSLVVSGDVKIIIYCQGTHSCHFWFNTLFLESGESDVGPCDYCIHLPKEEIDKACKDSKCKVFDEDFAIRFHMRSFLVR
jgi:phosphatidylinositol-3,4,5-trisphosphate 3-phosphatase and dual-specificity protein phosphatase PTEN